MHRISGRVVLVVLVVIVLGVSAAARSLSLPLRPGGGTSRLASSPLTTPSFPTPSVAHQGTAPRTRPSAPATPPTSTAPRTTSFQNRYTYDDGVAVSVTKIERTELHFRPVGVKVRRGTAIQILTVRITNGSRSPVRVAVASARMTYGRRQTVAPALVTRSITSFVGAFSPGRSKTSRYAFAVPRPDLNDTQLRFAFDGTHAPALFVGSLDYSPGNGTVFNDPTGSASEQFAITRTVERAVDAAPRGSTIQIAQYSFDIAGAADRLLAAHRRGVHVQMIVDQHQQIVTSETLRLLAALGAHRKRSSFLVRCRASCMSNRSSAMHAKFYLFSQVGGSRLVSMVGSANLTHTNSQTSWNDMQTVVGDPVLYGSLGRYFTDMSTDKNRPNYFRTTISGDHELYFYPQAPSSKPVVLLDVLNRVSCSGAAPGYGTKNHQTIVRVGMYSWTSTRADIARQLWRLHDSGCLVQVVYNSGRTSSAITHILLRRSAKHGQLNLHDAWIDRNRNNKAEQYMHEKLVTINGVLSGRRNTKTVYAGSQNFTPNATTDNNDLIFRTADETIYDAYAENFRSILDKTPRLRYFLRGFQHDVPQDQQ